MPKVPDALILIGTHCPLCPSVLAALAEMVKAGKIGKLEVVNVEARPDVAQALHVRSVPWVRLGGLTLTGVHSQAELEQWAQRAGTVEGQMAYLEEMLGSGQVSEATDFVRNTAGSMQAVIRLLADPQQKINVKAGIGVIVEDLEGSEILAETVDELGKLLSSESAEVRADVCYYLGLTHAKSARKYLERCLQDEDPDVREIAAESIQLLA